MPGRSCERPAPLSYTPALDGVRAVAVAAVLLFHADARYASGGFLGVSVFFTVSGFLVGSLLLDEHADTGTIDLAAFVTRRARRLLPAAWVGLAVVLAFVPFWNRGQIDRLGGDVLAALANVSNWRAAASDASYQDLFESSPSPLAHFWSLAIEMQFYVALPLLAALTLRARGRRLFVAAVVGLLAASIASIATTHDFDLAYNGTHTRAGELLVGVVLSIIVFHLRRGGHTLPQHANTFVGMTAIAGLTALVIGTSTRSEWLVGGGLVGVAMLTAALILSTLGTGPVPNLLAHPILVAIGKVSYGIYLFHWPIFLVLSTERTGLGGIALFLVRSLATAAATVVSYRLIETPIRRRRRLKTPWTITPAALASATALVVAAILLPGIPRDSTEALIAEGTDGLVRFDDRTGGEADDGPSQPPNAALAASTGSAIDPVHTPASSVAPPPAPPLTILVVGSDTAALDVVTELADSTTQRPLRVIDAVRPACPFADAAEVSVDGRVTDVSQCDSTSSTVATALDGGSPDLVVVAAGEIDSGVVRRADDVGFPTDDMLDAIAERYSLTNQAVDDLVGPFDDAGIPIVMSWWGGPGLFDLELGRVDVLRTAVVAFERDAGGLRSRVLNLMVADATSDQTAKVLVLGDSTSLVLARALHDGDDRLDVLWAGDNGCPIVRATSLHAGTGRPARALDCADFAVKLPPLLDDFGPDVVVVMPGTIALANLTFGADEEPHVPGSVEWIAYHDSEFAELLEVIRTSSSARSTTDPAILIADSPAIGRGPFSTPEMVTPERLAAVNAQIDRWATAHAGVDVLAYADPLERYEADFGSIRPDAVHPAAIELTEIARASLVDPVLDAASRQR